MLRPFFRHDWQRPLFVLIVAAAIPITMASPPSPHQNYNTSLTSTLLGVPFTDDTKPTDVTLQVFQATNTLFAVDIIMLCAAFISAIWQESINGFVDSSRSICATSENLCLILNPKSSIQAMTAGWLMLGVIRTLFMQNAGSEVPTWTIRDFAYVKSRTQIQVATIVFRPSPPTGTDGLSELRLLKPGDGNMTTSNTKNATDPLTTSNVHVELTYTDQHIPIRITLSLFLEILRTIPWNHPAKTPIANSMPKGTSILTDRRPASGAILSIDVLDTGTESKPITFWHLEEGLRMGLESMKRDWQRGLEVLMRMEAGKAFARVRVQTIPAPSERHGEGVMETLGFAVEDIGSINAEQNAGADMAVTW